MRLSTAPEENMRMQCSQKGIDLIKSFEGFSLTAYHGKCDRAGLYTIGWGHARGVRPGDKITLEQAEKLLRDDIRDAENVVNIDYVSGRDKPLVTQNQFDALVSFVFNVKRESYLDSTLRRKLKAGDKMGAAGEFKRWIYSDHKIAPGLIPRRDAERRLFMQSGAADIAALLLGVMLIGSVVLVAMLFML